MKTLSTFIGSAWSGLLWSRAEGKRLKIGDMRQIKSRWETTLRARLQEASVWRNEILTSCRFFFRDRKRRSTLWRILGLQFAIIFGIVILQKAALITAISDSRPIEMTVNGSAASGSAAAGFVATSPQTLSARDESTEHASSVVPRDELRRQQFETLVATTRGLRRVALTENFDSRRVGYWSKLQNDIVIACASPEIYLQFDKVMDYYEDAKRLIEGNNCIGSLSSKNGLRSGDWVTIAEKSTSSDSAPLHCLRSRGGNVCYWTAADWK